MKRLFIILLAFLFSVFLIGHVSAECSGGADLDIYKIERMPGESTFKVIATANGNGDCLKIAWTKEDLNNILNKESPEELTDKDITGDITLISQTEKFATHSWEDLPLYDMEYGGWLGYCTNICSSEGHPISPPDGYAIRNGLLGCYCVYKTGVEGSVGVFGSRTFNDGVEISFSGLSSTIMSTTYSEGEEPVGTAEIYEKVSVSYRGSLIGNNWLEKPEFNPFKSGINYKLVLGDSADAKSERDELLNCLNESSSPSIAESCISNYENKINSLFSLDKKGEWISNEQIVEDAYFEGNDFKVEKKIFSTQWPQFTLTFDAEWAGVHWITGQPKVTCPQDDSLFSGESKTLDFIVENVDGEKGAFTLDLNCGEISSTLDKNKLLLGSRASNTVRGTITDASDEDKNLNCNFKAFATRNPSKFDECSFDIEVKKLLERTELSSENEGSSITGRAIGSGNSSSGGVIILIVILVLIAGTIGIYYYRNKKVTTTTVQKSASISSGNHCTRCGSLLRSDGGFCTNCGKKSFK